MKKQVKLAFLLAITASCVHAQVAVPTHPLPTQLATASKIFISNVSEQPNADSVRVYDNIFQGVQSNARFHIVLNPDDADVILEIRYYGRMGPDRYYESLVISLVQPQKHVTLWSMSEDIPFASTRGGHEKNLDKATASLLTDLSSVTTTASGPPPTKP
jgi:hypothetical protein